MSVTYIPAELRRIVITRANACCEYCRIADDDTHYGCELDHIISEKHGGETEAYNLALVCARCNQAKGSDIGSIHWESGLFVRLYNPRTDRWAEHFQLIGCLIEGVSPIGMVTANLLGFNTEERVLLRSVLQEAGRFPTSITD